MFHKALSLTKPLGFIKGWDFFFCLVMISLFYYWMADGIIFAPDSQGYITGDILRPPLYPMLLQLLSGKEHGVQFYPLLLLQLSAGFFAAVMMARTLQTLFELKNLYFWCLVCLFITPYFGHLGNYVLTEGLAYPLFLLSVSALLKGMLEDNAKHLHYFFWCVALLVLVRGQFLFMYVIAAVALFYIIFLKPSYKGKSLLVISLIASLCLSQSFDKIYHGVQHGCFVRTPAFGVHFVIAPLYLSKLEDQVLFTSDDRLIFIELHKSIMDKKLNHEHAVGYVDAPYHFYTSFNEILYGNVYPVLRKYEINDPVVADGFLTKMSATLIKQHWVAYLKLCFRNFAAHFGGFYGLFLVGFAMVLSGIRHGIERTPLSLCLFFATLMSLGNSALIACLQPYLIRYAFYTHIFLAAIVVIILTQTLKPRHIL